MRVVASRSGRAERSSARGASGHCRWQCPRALKKERSQEAAYANGRIAADGAEASCPGPTCCPRFRSNKVELTSCTAAADGMKGQNHGYSVRSAENARRSGSRVCRRRRRLGPDPGRRHRPPGPDAQRSGRAGHDRRHQEDRRADRHRGNRGRRLPDRRCRLGRGAARASQAQQGVAGCRRSHQSDRLDPDPGPRHAGWQSLQRLAGGGQRAGHGRGGRDRHHPGTERAS